MSDTPPSGTPPQAGAPDADPSMEEILASIRRILNEDETPPAETSETGDAAAEDDVLVLDQSMLVEARDVAARDVAKDAEPTREPAIVPDAGEPEEDDFNPPPLATAPPPRAPEPEPVAPPPRADPPMEVPAAAMDLGMLAPEAAAAAASSISSLVRTLTAGRATQVYSGGPTLEDMVRAELRPLLKSWLDVYLPPMVERLVRVEIERVVGRAVP